MGRLSVSSSATTKVMVALVVLDVILVGVALRSNHSSAIDTRPLGTGTAPTISADAALTPSSTPSDSASSPASTTASPPAVPLRTMLVALDTRRAWRVESGSCSAGGATLATTTNGGKTWANTKAPLRAIVRVRPADNKAAFVIGADSSCAAELTNTTDGGGTWGSASAVGSAWFRDPKNPRVVGTPRASTSRPCGKHAVVDLAAVSTASARVLCADGLIRSTTNTASSWSDSGKVAGAVALAVLSGDPGKTYVAQLGAPQCAGVQVQQVGRSAATSCLETSVPEAQGQVALSLVKNGGWLAVGEKTMRSIDGLLTWSVS